MGRGKQNASTQASAVLDRLLHRATVINIRGDSYRMKSRQRAGERIEVAGGAEAGALLSPGQTTRRGTSRDHARSQGR